MPCPVGLDSNLTSYPLPPTDRPLTAHRPPPTPTNPRMPWFQKTVSLRARSRGCYLITSEIKSALPELSRYRIGLLTLSLQHTSCALSLNENYDELVRVDMRDALERIVPEVVEGGYQHCDEGSDDMPAHVKSALIGVTVTVPITDGELAMGTWQGLSFYSCPSLFFICVWLVGWLYGAWADWWQEYGIWSLGGRGIPARLLRLFMGS